MASGPRGRQSPDWLMYRARDRTMGKAWWRDVVLKTFENAGAKVDPFEDFFDAVYREFARPGIWRLNLECSICYKIFAAPGFV